MSAALLMRRRGGSASEGTSRRTPFGLEPVAFNRGYEAGSLSIRDPDLPTSAIGVNAAAERGRMDVVIARCRYLVRNNELVRNAVEMRTARVVGKRMGWEPDTGIDSLNDKLRDRRDHWSERADPQRKRSLTEICATAFRERLIAGEFGRLVSWSPSFRGYDAGPAIELWPFERMPLDLAGRVATATNDGNWVRQGIEFDAQRRAVAYWVLVDHPSDQGTLGWFGSSPWSTYGVAGYFREDDPAVRRLAVGPAELCYVEHESGQLRGAPPIAAVMRTIRAEDGYIDNVMLLQQLLASLGVFFSVEDTRVFDRAMRANLPQIVDVNGNPITRVTGATIGVVPKGTEIKTANMQGVTGPQFEAVNRMSQRRGSRAFGLPFGTYSGDSSQDSFSSRRADEIDCRDVDEVEQHLLYRWIVEPFQRSVIAADLLSGALRISSEERAELDKTGWHRLYWAAPAFDGFSYVNPAQEASADALQVQTGTKSQIGIIQSQGGDWRSIVDQRLEYEAYEARRREELGLAAAAPSGSGDAGGKGDQDEPEDKPDPEDRKPGERKSEARASGRVGRTEAAARGPDPLSVCLEMTLAETAGKGAAA